MQIQRRRVLGAVHLKASHLVIMALMGGPGERQRRIDRRGAKEGQNLLELTHERDWRDPHQMITQKRREPRLSKLFHNPHDSIPSLNV